MSDPDVFRILPVLGPSGSGKSSVARAGLIPELARRPLPGWRSVRVALTTPGAHPLESLARVLARVATGDTSPIAKQSEFELQIKSRVEAGYFDGLRRIADSLPEIQDSPLLVLVDQFEEVFSQCKDADARTAFIENLLNASRERGGRVSVVLTLRTDFLGETHRHEELNRLVCSERHHVMIPSMNERELRDAIASPAELAHNPFEEALVNQMIADTKDREGA